MENACWREVQELHQFFEDWLNGTVAVGEETFRRLPTVLAERFTIVFPDGRLWSRQELIDRIRAGHGSSPPNPIRISVAIRQGRPLSPDHYLLLYEEWHESAKERRGRLSSAVFGARGGTPNRVEWLHVHEAWLAG